MKHMTKFAAVAVAALGLGGVSACIAVASPTTTPVVSAPSSQQAEPTSADSDTLQQGDQTTPDTPATAGQGAENNAETESQDATDGPGGHADPAGDVQHEANGTE
jgi:hypothetical protein